MKNFIHLGRYGDVINTLPLLKHFASLQGSPVKQVVSAKYADVLQGVSYVEPVIFPGDFHELRTAIRFAEDRRLDAINLQVYGKDMPMQRHCSSFVMEQWHRAGMADAWGTLPLVFDLRDAQREKLLIDTVRSPGAYRPLILAAVDGFSSPFAHGPALIADLHALFPEAHVVDLRTVKATRVYDLLGLFDVATCLLTIDTMHMHLAQGSRVPVIALATDGPTSWHGSAQRPGQVWYGSYASYIQQREQLLRVVGGLVKTKSPFMGETKGGSKARASKTVLATPPPAPSILHVYSAHTATGHTLRRMHTAQESWRRAYTECWTPVPFTLTPGARSAADLGDTRTLPYVKDMVATAISKARRDSDIVVFSNSDVCMTEGISSQILKLCGEHGALYTHRWDFPFGVQHIRSQGVGRGKWYPGSDLFAFTLRWWKAHGGEYPDMLLGAEYVDAVLRQLIKKRAHPASEIHQAVYHEMHTNAWSIDRRSPANLHNARLARAWFRAHCCDDLDPFATKQAQGIRQQRGTPLFQLIAP